MKRLCVIYGNCQGTALELFLRRCPAFRREFDISTHSNWQNKPFPAGLLERCHLLLHQPTKARKGLAPSTDEMRAALPAGSRAVSFPYVYFNGYWPFHADSPNPDVGPVFPKERHYYADSVLDRLAATPLPLERVLRLYLSLDFQGEHPAAEGVRETLRIQREREEHTDVKSADLIEELHRKQPIFLTVRHPSNLLYLLTTNRLLDLLGLPALGPEVLDEVPSPYRIAYEHPIHPGLAEALGLRFVTPETRYNLWGELFSYEEYLADYVFSRRLAARAA